MAPKHNVLTMIWGDIALARHEPVEDEASIDLNVCFFRRQNLNKYQRAFLLGVGAHIARHACLPCKARPIVILECGTAALPTKTNAEQMRASGNSHLEHVLRREGHQTHRNYMCSRRVARAAIYLVFTASQLSRLA